MLHNLMYICYSEKYTSFVCCHVSQLNEYCYTVLLQGHYLDSWS